MSIHLFANSFRPLPMGIELLLSHACGSRTLGFKNGLRRSASGNFGLPAERSDHPGWSASGQGGPSSHISDTLSELSVPMLAGMSHLCRKSGLGRFFSYTS